MRRQAFILCCVPALLACLWDYDTLMQERSRFPQALELITGKYLRHSTEFYQWRIDDRLKKLQGDPNNLAWLDDLGVAYAKVGQVDKAIETMARKERIKTGLYETAANLGTFYIYAGQLDDARKEIEKALQINPDAHFGREKYQLMLVNYILASRKQGVKGMPLNDSWNKEFPIGPTGFAAVALKSDKENRLADRTAALKGVMGMMRAGHHDMPLLLEVLGDLLFENDGAPENDAKRMAARAYLKASYGVTAKTEKDNYRKLAEQALRDQVISATEEEGKVGKVESELKKELAEADAWYADLKQKEIGWIKDGKNPEEEFEKLYKADPEIQTGIPTTWDRVMHFAGIAGFVRLTTGVLALLGYGSYKLLKLLWWMAG